MDSSLIFKDPSNQKISNINLILYLKSKKFNHINIYDSVIDQKVRDQEHEFDLGGEYSRMRREVSDDGKKSKQENEKMSSRKKSKSNKAKRTHPSKKRRGKRRFQTEAEKGPCQRHSLYWDFLGY